MVSIKCLVGGHDDGGNPDFFPVIVRVTLEEKESNIHEDVADEWACDQGWDTYGLVYTPDNTYPALAWLFKKFDWTLTPTVDSPKVERGEE
jgi:hypothetical protein